MLKPCCMNLVINIFKKRILFISTITIFTQDCTPNYFRLNQTSGDTKPNAVTQLSSIQHASLSLTLIVTGACPLTLLPCHASCQSEMT